jgi:hypothetical protein
MAGPLHDAAMRGDLAAVRAVLAQPLASRDRLANLRDSHGDTALGTHDFSVCRYLARCLLSPVRHGYYPYGVGLAEGRVHQHRASRAVLTRCGVQASARAAALLISRGRCSVSHYDPALE